MKTATEMKKGKPGEVKNKETTLDSVLELVIFCLIHVLIFTVLYHTIYKMPYSANGLYFDYASKVLHGSLPYRDFSFEYPPFSLVFFILPRLATSTYEIYSVFYQLEVLIFDLIGLFLVYLIARRLGKAPWKLMTIYTIGILAIGPIIANQFDIFPAVMTLAAIYFFWLGKHKTSWVFLALGTVTKIYPAVIAPIFLIYYLKNRQYRQMISGLIVFAAICLAVVIPFLIFGSESIINLINYHSQRGIQLESTYSALLLLANKLGLLQVHWVFSYGSVNLTGPLADAFAKASTYIMGLALIIAYWFIWKQMKPGKSQFTRIGAYSLLVIVVLLVTSKVLSPQYLIWLIPFLPLLFGDWRNYIIALFAVIGLFTYFIFPVTYKALEYFAAGPVFLLVIRDTLLILLAVLIGIALKRMKASD
jgi:uncharacterized membrane protein